MGLSFAGFFDPQQGQANAVGRFVNTIAMLAFVALNGPLAVFATVVESFSMYPGRRCVVRVRARATRPCSWAGEIFALALNLALPFMALLLFVEPQPRRDLARGAATAADVDRLSGDDLCRAAAAHARSADDRGAAAASIERMLSHLVR
jgi:hypothetical protein